MGIIREVFGRSLPVQFALRDSSHPCVTGAFGSGAAMKVISSPCGSKAQTVAKMSISRVLDETKSFGGDSHIATNRPTQVKPQTAPVRDHQRRIVDLREVGCPLAIERVIERMGENVTEVVRTARHELRLRKVGRPSHTFAGVDVPTVGIRIAVLVA